MTTMGFEPTTLRFFCFFFVVVVFFCFFCLFFFFCFVFFQSKCLFIELPAFLCVLLKS